MLFECQHTFKQFSVENVFIVENLCLFMLNEGNLSHTIMKKKKRLGSNIKVNGANLIQQQSYKLRMKMNDEKHKMWRLFVTKKTFQLIASTTSPFYPSSKKDRRLLFVELKNICERWVLLLRNIQTRSLHSSCCHPLYHYEDEFETLHFVKLFHFSRQFSVTKCEGHKRFTEKSHKSCVISFQFIFAVFSCVIEEVANFISELWKPIRLLYSCFYSGSKFFFWCQKWKFSSSKQALSSLQQNHWDFTQSLFHFSKTIFFYHSRHVSVSLISLRVVFSWQCHRECDAVRCDDGEEIWNLRRLSFTQAELLSNFQLFWTHSTFMLSNREKRNWIAWRGFYCCSEEKDIKVNEGFWQGRSLFLVVIKSSNFDSFTSITIT